MLGFRISSSSMGFVGFRKRSMLRLLSNLNYFTVPEKALNAKVQLRLDLMQSFQEIWSFP